MVLVKPLDDPRLKTGLPKTWKVYKKGPKKSKIGSPETAPRDKSRRATDGEPAEANSDENTAVPVDDGSEPEYENEFFMITTHESWALIAKATSKTKFRILFKLDEPDQKYRVVAMADDWMDILHDWEVINAHVYPVLKRNPDTKRSALDVNKMLGMVRKNSLFEPAFVTSTGSIKTKRIRYYDVKKAIGQGAFGRIKLGVHHKTGKEVALKMMSKDKVKSMQTLKREIQVFQGLHHPSIIDVIEVINREKYVCLVLEFASGGDLLDYINSCPHCQLGEKESARVFYQIAQGVQYLHSQNVIHRDLKPDNILLDAKKNVKISDFGLSKRIDNKQQYLKTNCGSAIYAAPELGTKRYLGPPVDVWGCGVILYNILFGCQPFGVKDGESVPSIYKKIRTGNIRFKTDMNVSEAALDVIRVCLCLKVEERANIEEVLARDWLKSEERIYTAMLKPGLKSTPERIAQYAEECKRNITRLSEAAGDQIFNWQLVEFVNEVQIYTLTNSDGGSVLNCKGRGLVKYPFEVVKARIGDSEWMSSNILSSISEMTLMEKLDSNTDIVYSIHDKTAVFTKTARDFCQLVHRETDTETGRFFVGEVSVEHDGCPLQSGYVRGNNDCSGWVVEPMGQNSCMVACVFKLDLKGNVEDEDIKEMSRELPMMVDKLRKVLAEEEKTGGKKKPVKA